MNLPNKLTMMRVLLIPIFMVLASIKTPMGLLFAGIVFAVASFTDYLDGHIARKHNLVTDFGKFADPLADKLLTTIAFIYMMADGVCSPIVLSIILAREFAVSGVRMIAAGAPGGKVIAANMWGKVKTALQMVTIVVYYIGRALEWRFYGFSNVVGVITMVLCWVIAAVTAISGIQYIWNNRQFINTAK
ncbi:MAG: CDP-diacylglycerol--glycerol-3-phosphate 3-phosphatidyltransferase [Ruthenibacterium sp.]